MGNLYNRIQNLCDREKINITTMCTESGASRGSLTDLKMGRKQSLSADTLSKIAAYFGVTVDYLLTGEEKEKPAAQTGSELTMDDFTYALYDETKELTPENKEKMLEMAKFFKQQQDLKNK